MPKTKLDKNIDAVLYVDHVAALDAMRADLDEMRKERDAAIADMHTAQGLIEAVRAEYSDELIAVAGERNTAQTDLRAARYQLTDEISKAYDLTRQLANVRREIETRNGCPILDTEWEAMCADDDVLTDRAAMRRRVAQAAVLQAHRPQETEECLDCGSTTDAKGFCDKYGPHHIGSKKD